MVNLGIEYVWVRYFMFVVVKEVILIVVLSWLLMWLVMLLKNVLLGVIMFLFGVGCVIVIGVFFCILLIGLRNGLMCVYVW